MKCEKCGGDFPHKKGRYCGTCNWNSPTFDAALARRKREGQKLGQHIWPNGSPIQKERSGGFSMTIMEMEELATIKAGLKIATEALIQISDLGTNFGYGRCECGKCYACLAHNTLKQLARMGVKL